MARTIKLVLLGFMPLVIGYALNYAMLSWPLYGWKLNIISVALLLLWGLLAYCAAAPGEESGCAGTSAVRSRRIDAAACAVSGLGVGTVLDRHCWLQHTDVLFTVDVFEFRSIGICFSCAVHNGVAVLRDRLGLHVCRRLSGLPPETEKRIALREKKKTLMKTSPASACENIRRPSCFSWFILL